MAPIAPLFDAGPSEEGPQEASPEPAKKHPNRPAVHLTEM